MTDGTTQDTGQADGEAAGEADAHDSGQNSGQAGAAPIEVNAQYVKDLSFENPRAPQSLINARPPAVAISVDVNANRLGAQQFEVELIVTVNSTVEEGQSLFLVELIYAGLFTLRGVAEEHLQMFLLIECPRLLFPFAREIVWTVTRDGGYPPLLMQPVDFAALYNRSLKEGKVVRETSGPDETAS